MVKTDLPLIIGGGGSGSDAAYLRELKTKKPENVEFVGFLTGDDLFSLYAHAKIFVFPSEYEAMSMALLEELGIYGSEGRTFPDYPNKNYIRIG